jgi:hypothetical protein
MISPLKTPSQTPIITPWWSIFRSASLKTDPPNIRRSVPASARSVIFRRPTNINPSCCDAGCGDPMIRSSMSEEVHMYRMSWQEYRERLSSSKTPIFLPVGALEQHGPHLPLGTDALLATAIAAGAAAASGGIVAPALSYGYKSQPKCGGGQHFCGTTSLDAATLIGQVRDVIREFVRHGVERLVLVNGHYENQWFMIEGIDLALRECGPNRLSVMRLEYWDFCT